MPIQPAYFPALAISSLHQPSIRDVFPLSKLEIILLSESNASHAAEWGYYYTSQSHFPGEGKEQALWTKRKWEEFGIPETEIFKYNASISVPVFQRLALIDTSEIPSPSVIYEAKLMEELPFNDPSEIRTPDFHGQSSSGNVTAQFVYANFGREQDYDDLEQSHVNATPIILHSPFSRTCLVITDFRLIASTFGGRSREEI